jgi:hypothetical protein
MRTSFVAVAGALAVFVGIFVLSGLGPARADKPLVNLKVYPKGTSRDTIKKDMKVLAKAVGKKCDDCHVLPNFDTDTELKEEAREMMRMTNQINAQLKKDGFKDTIGCATCHRGEEKPSH